MKCTNKSIPAGIFLAGILTVSVHAQQTELISNGDFETGSFAPWVVTDQAGGDGSFYIITSTDSPGGNLCCPTAGPKSGNAAASSGQSGPGAHAITQTFTVPAGAVKVLLSFDQFVNDYDSGFINPAGLDYTANPNDQARVDLLTSAAATFDTGASVIRNFYIGNDGAVGSPHAYTHYSFDITANVTPGGTYKIRFAEADNQNFFNQGVDNVSITATLAPLLVTYAANLSAGDSVIDITNTGFHGASLPSGTTASITGAICANVYAFTPDEQLVSCCSCPVTPNGLVSLSANNDLASNTLTPAVPSALVVKVLATLPVAGSCTNSAAAVATAPLATGVSAWGSTIHATPVVGQFGITETPLSIATLSAGELNRLGSLCNFILANGSGFGVCRSCRLGGLGGNRQ